MIEDSEDGRSLSLGDPQFHLSNPSGASQFGIRDQDDKDSMKSLSPIPLEPDRSQDIVVTELLTAIKAARPVAKDSREIMGTLEQVLKYLDKDNSESAIKLRRLVQTSPCGISTVYPGI